MGEKRELGVESKKTVGMSYNARSSFLGGNWFKYSWLFLMGNALKNLTSFFQPPLQTQTQKLICSAIHVYFPFHKRAAWCKPEQSMSPVCATVAD